MITLQMLLSWIIDQTDQKYDCCFYNSATAGKPCLPQPGLCFWAWNLLLKLITSKMCVRNSWLFPCQTVVLHIWSFLQTGLNSYKYHPGLIILCTRLSAILVSLLILIGVNCQACCNVNVWLGIHLKWLHSRNVPSSQQGRAFCFFNYPYIILYAML